NEESMEKIGKALGTLMYRRGLGKKAVVGNDVRKSGPALSSALRKGLLATGIDVLDIGTTSFGLALFSGYNEKCVTAYVTASHNPPEWNGVKFFEADCIGFFEKDNKEIGTIVESGEFHKGHGSEKKIDYRGKYADFLKTRFRRGEGLKIVLDCGNGSTSLVAPEIFRELGFDVVELFCDPHHEFPGRGPDVTEEACKKLGETIRRSGASLGIAFDGDGDRMAVVDEKGRFVTTDAIAVAFAKEMLRGKRRAKIICNIDCSMRMERELEPLGAEIIRIPVGNTFMMQSAKKHSAVFGTESSQHFVFPSYLPFDDGIVAGLKMAEMVSLSGKPASSFFTDPLPRKTSTIPCPEQRKQAVMEEIERFSEGYRIDKTDGIRYVFKDGWGLIRPSNTSPAIRITAESFSQEATNSIFDEMKRITEDIV
ncbi:MAG: phosphomannomutase/phosphoglucomutase, partial [Candidatus Aenigmatarchaeota archaeon]